jgi:hypothetical protein
MAGKAKALGILVGIAGLALVASVAFAAEKPATDSSDDNDGVAEQQYKSAMDPGQTDPDYVQSVAVWLAGSGQRPDLAAKVQEKYYALVSEMALRKALEPGLLSESFLVQTAADLETMTPTYAALVRQRLAVQQGTRSPGTVTIKLLSGVGTMTINFDTYVQTAEAPAVVTPPVVTLNPPAVAPAAVPTAATSVPATEAPPTFPAPSAAPSEPVATVPPLVVAEVEPAADPNGTIALAQAMKAEEESTGWKYVSDALKDWQRRTGRKVDGKFGTGDALRMAQEVGNVPLIRYWSLNGKPLATLLPAYREQLRVLAASLKASAPQHAAALLLSAVNETGQGWPKSSVKAAPPVVPMTEGTIQSAVESLDDTDAPLSSEEWEALQNRMSFE